MIAKPINLTWKERLCLFFLKEMPDQYSHCSRCGDRTKVNGKHDSPVKINGFLPTYTVVTHRCISCGNSDNEFIPCKCED